MYVCMCVCTIANVFVSSILNQTHLFCIFDIYLVAFMLEIIMMTRTSWQVTAPLCKCNCLLFLFLLILLHSFNIFISIVIKPDGKWYYVQHSTNKQTTNFKCFWRIYLDKIGLFLIVVQWYLGWFYLFFNNIVIAIILSFLYSIA